MIKEIYIMDEIIEKIKKYVNDHLNSYTFDGVLKKFFDENNDVELFINELVKNEPWFISPKKALFLISKGITEKQYCKTCKKELTYDAVKRGSVYCSGGCKSRDNDKKKQEAENRINNEKIYEVDFSIKLSDEVINEYKKNHNKPYDLVLEKIKNFYKHDSKGIGLFNLLRSNKDVDKYLTDLVLINPWMKNKKNAFWFVKNELYEGLKCKKCGKHLSPKQIRDNHEYCSAKCAQNDDELRERLKKTNLDKYGVEYGLQNDEIKEKIKKTNLERYGVENIFSSKEMRDKRDRGFLEKYGTIYPAASKKVRAKIANTNMERYGSATPFGNKEVLEKCRKLYVKRSYKRLVEKLKDYFIPMFTEEEYQGWSREYTYKWKCVKCGNVFEQKGIYTTGFGYDSIFPRCLKCNPFISGFSGQEKEVVDFIKSVYSGKIVENDRKLIKPFELDVYLSDVKLAIEYDGLYWHSTATGKDEYYHLNKTERCLEKGVQLIHIFEDEWLYKQDIIKDIIKSKLNIYDHRVYARCCEIREVDFKEASDFLDKNHIQGRDNSSIRYGLYHDGELVSLMTFGKPRFNKHFKLELMRFSTKLGYQVVGGASRLISVLKRKYDCSIISYADRRYSCGKLYEKLGFKLIGKSAPNYCYVRENEKYSRYQCQKSKIGKILGDKFDENLTEYENMKINGFDILYDCGNLIYVLE